MGTVVDAVVIGGGIAGASIAPHLARRGVTVLLEAEAAVAHHTTGRSAAAFLESYGSATIRRLTVASRAFMTEHDLLTPRPVLFVGTDDQQTALVAHAAEAQRLVPNVRLLDGEAARARCPVLRPGHITGAVLEPDADDLDVHGTLSALLAGFAAAGGTVRTAAPVTAIDARRGSWRVEAGGETYDTAVVVDAAGAWGDAVAALAGVRPVGLSPLRRTAFTSPVPEGSEHEDWPLVVDVDERFYFKPEGPQLLCSLADETPSEPCDARPEEVDVALALERINEATTLGLRSARRPWAGLRTFAPDRDPVVGHDPDAPGFVWLVGQGGYGIQTAPALGRLAAALAVGEPVPPDLAALGVTAADVGPARFR